MNYALAADGVVLLHFLFVVYALLGAALVLRRLWTVWFHLACVAWAAWIEFSGSICPLTPLENHLRRLAGEQGYENGFVAHYLLPVLYPDGLTRSDQIMLGVAFLGVNVILYGLVIRQRQRRHRSRKWTT